MSEEKVGMDDLFSKEELDRVEQGNQELRRTSGKPEICTCGHPVRKHYLVGAEKKVDCAGLQSQCKCTRIIPIARVANARHFMFKTDEKVGLAFLRGLAALKAKDPDAEVEYLLEKKCMSFVTPDDPEEDDIECESTRNVVLAEVNMGRGTITAFLCEEHR